MKTVRVNRAPIQIRHLGRGGDSGHDTFEKKNPVLHLVVSQHPGSGSESPFRLDRKGVLQCNPSNSSLYHSENI